jgi:hypothetical protein
VGVSLIAAETGVDGCRERERETGREGERERSRNKE